MGSPCAHRDEEEEVRCLGSWWWAAAWPGSPARWNWVEHQVEVVLIDRNNYLQFQPLLYQVASSQLPAEDVARPLNAIFADLPTVTVLQDDVTGIDFATRDVTAGDGSLGPADYLVLAAGAQPNFFGVTGAGEHSFPLYSVADGERLRLHLHEQLRVHCHPDPAPGPLNVVVVGGGPTGVETAGAIAELFDCAARRTTGSATTPRCTWSITAHALLNPFSDKSHRYALEKLTEHGVKVTFGVAVTQVGPDTVHLSDGTVLPTRTVVWGGGESASAGRLRDRRHARARWADRRRRGPVRARIPRRLRRRRCREHSRPGRSCAAATRVRRPAIRQVGGTEHPGRRSTARRPTPFHYHDKGIMAMIGRNAAVAEVGAHRHQVEGPIAFAAWLGLHAILLSGAHSRVDAFLNWADDYFHHARAADLELGGTPGRIAWADDHRRPARHPTTHHPIAR